MRKIILLFGLLLAFVFPATPAAASEDGLWLYRESADTVPEEQAVVWAWSAMAQDEHWAIFDFPEAPPLHEGARSVWLTTRLADDTPDGATILFGTSGQTVRVWIDDKPVYQYGALAPSFSGGGSSWHYIELPPGAAGHQFTIECYGPFPRELGKLHYFYIDTDRMNMARVFLFDATFMITLPVAVAMFIVALFFYVREKTNRRLYRALLSFLGVFAVWSFSGIQAKFLVIRDVPLCWYMMSLAAYLLPITANYIIYEVIEQRFRAGVRWIMRGYGLLMFTAIVGEMLGWHALKNLMPFYFLFIAIYEPVAFYWTFRSAQSGSPYCKALLAPIAAFTGLGVVDGINSFFSFLPFNFYVSPFGIFALAAFLLAVLHDFVDRERQLGAQADSLASDIAAARAHEEYDTLTHCLTRSMYEPLLIGAIRDARVKQHPFSVLMFDIDHFKGFNDTFGHEAGDEVLAGFAVAIRHELNDAQPFLRWGGEEFIVLLPDCNLIAAAQIAENLRQRIATLSLHARQITTSIGVATWHGAGDTKENHFERVDAALYRAKEGGRNRVEVES